MTISFYPLVMAAGFGLLIALLINFRDRRGAREGWFIGFLSASVIMGVLVSALHGMPNAVWVQRLAMYSWALSLMALLFLTLDYGDWDSRRPAVVGALIWLALLVLADLLPGEKVLIGTAAQRLIAYPLLNLGGLLFLSVWLVVAVGLLTLTVLASARARLPLYANRLLYWAGALTLIFIGQWLFAMRESYLSVPGGALQLLGSGGLLYGIVSYRIFDVRGWARRAMGYAISTLLTTGVMVAAVLAARGLLDREPGGGAVTGVVVLIVALAAVHQLVFHWLDKFITRFIIDQEYDPAVIVENYARAIGNILDMETLATVAIGTISEVLEIQRGRVMVITEENRRVVVQPIGGMGPATDTPMSFPRDSILINYFVKNRQPLLQYNIDVLPEFRSLSREQRQWLASLQMDVYMPIMPEGLPIGLLALGPKGSGEPYRSDDLQLVQTLAGQTVVALTNARLFDDMKKLNAEIQLLNQDLRRSNERLQYMDQVKTDFITIASHELRTPLTQIKGYADIMDAMNESNLLTQGEAGNLLGNVSRAADQLERVISAMLDSSQIDVDAMSLNVSETDLDAVLRAAIHPLAQAMRDRKLALTVQGVRNLPPIMADFQRLVQAFNNLVSNAIKYTPDNGRINISAQVTQDDLGVDREVEIIVSDTGVGVDPRDHELIFEKFFRAADPQLHSSSNTKFMGAGPGLGLSIVRGIVDSHGGRIWVESEGNDPARCPGSEFHVVLPIRHPSSSLEQTQPAAEQAL